MVEPTRAFDDGLLGSEPWVRSSSFCDYFARFDIWSLNIDRADAELLVPEEFPKGIGPIMLDQVRLAFDLADEIRLITSRIKISVPNLPIIVRAYRVVTLADMDRNMNILGQVFNCYIKLLRPRSALHRHSAGSSMVRRSGYACSLLGQVS